MKQMLQAANTDLKLIIVHRPVDHKPHNSECFKIYHFQEKSVKTNCRIFCTLGTNGLMIHWFCWLDCPYTVPISFLMQLETPSHMVIVSFNILKF